MKAKLVAFGEVQIEGERYARDVVIDGGRVSRRRKGPSKALREEFGHTPLSVAEEIPWGGRRLVVGTGAEGKLPIARTSTRRRSGAGSRSMRSRLRMPAAC